MTRTLRRLIFYPLLAATMAASVAWVLCMPDRRARLARAIPDGARWVGVHRALADRWPQIAANPLILEAVRQAGVPEEEWAALADDPVTRRWMRRLAGDEIVAAQWPALRGGQAFGAASWIGGWSPRLRWLLASGGLSDVRKLSDYRGRPLWVVRSRTVPQGLHLAVAVEEGMLLACVAPHPGEICRMLDAYDRVEPSFPPAAAARGGGAPDRVVIDLGRGPGPDLLQLDLDRLEARRIEGRAALSGWEHPFEAATLPENLNLAPMAELLGPYAEGVAVIDGNLLARLAEPLLRWRWYPAVPEHLRPVCFGPAVVGLFGDPYAGRYHGLRVPGFTLSMRSGEATAVDAAVDRLLDQLNAQERWGLIRGGVPGAPGLWAVEATSECEYATLPAGERMAFVTTNGWWSLGSNTETIKGLLAAMAPPEKPLPWTSAGAASGPHSGRVWLDLERGADTLRLSLSVYALKQQVADAQGSAPLRRRLDLWKDWIAAAGVLGSARVGISAEGDRLGMAFRLGADEPSAPAASPPAGF